MGTASGCLIVMLVVIVVVVLFFVIPFASHHSQNEVVSSPTVDPLSKANSDAEARTVWLSYEMSLLQGNMKNPEAFKPTSVLLTSDGRVCVNYMSTNSFGATLQGWAILEKSGTIWSEEAAESRWHRECKGKQGTQQWTDALGGRLIAVSPAEVPPTPAKETTTGAAQGDEAAKLISKCGKPDRDFTRTEGGQPIRHVIYKKQNVELMYSRQGVPAWVLVGIFEANGEDNMETDEANRRLPCAGGSIHSVLDRR